MGSVTTDTINAFCGRGRLRNMLSRSDTFFRQMGSSNKRYTLTIFLLLILFLASILLISKRNLQPSLSLYTSFFSQGQIAVGSPSDSAQFSTESKDSNISVTAQFVGDKEIPVAQNESPAKDNNDEDLSFESVAVNSPAESAQFPTESKDSNISVTGPFLEVKETPVAQNESFVNDNTNEDTLFENDNGACDLHLGTWVKDEGYPLYEPSSCPYVDEAFDCQSNGRPDSSYLRWRWKPDGCDLPRFNATDFLERLRGKRLMLVGDSMNRNQFESLLCLLREGLTNKSRMYEIYGHKITKGRGYYVFTFLDYNCTVEFVRSHFLVKEGVRVNGQGNSNPTLSIDQIDKQATKWKRANILVFNTGHWWVHGKTARGKNYFKEGDYLYPKFDAAEAYRKALKTWGKWIDSNINPLKQLVFYRGYSSAHFRGGDWDSGGSCNGETEPILSGSFLDSYPLKTKTVEDVIHEMQNPVVLLNVTRLTNFRKDGHPSIYGHNITDGRKSRRRQDCSHWCLPGIPDAWNELIYATLVLKRSDSGHS